MIVTPKYNNLIEYIQSDYIYIVVLLFALLACLYTIEAVGSYQQECNQYWVDQLNETDCFNCLYPPPDNFTGNFSLMLPIKELINNGNKDPD